MEKIARNTSTRSGGGVSKKEFFLLNEKRCLLDSATAIECVHAFSLVHDDLLPRIRLRRGKEYFARRI